MSECEQICYQQWVDMYNKKDKECKEVILDTLIGCIDTSCDLFEIEVKQIQQLFKEER